MSKSYVVGIDGSEGSIRTAQYALAQAQSAGASLKVLHVLEWSPYSFLTPEELEERKKRRREELERANSAILEPIIEKLGADGIEGEVRYGQIAEVISTYCDEIGAEQCFVGRHGGGGLTSRLFGSVPGSLVQISNVPVTVVP